MNVPKSEVPAQLKFPNLLKKTFSKKSEEPVGFGITCPMWIDYRTNKNADIVRRKLQKEASESALFIRDLTEAYKNGFCITERSMNNFIKMGLSFSEKEKYEKTGAEGLNQESRDFMEKAKAAIVKMSSDLNPEPLKALFKNTIQKERAHAAIAALFVRILSGSDAPKVKFLDSPTHPESHGQLLSSLVKGCDLIELSATAISLYDIAPKIAAEALMRYMIGCDPKEVKFENFLYSEGKVMNIDMDWSFNTGHRLNAQTSGSNGAKALFTCDPNDNDRMAHKRAWDGLFDSRNDQAVTHAMNEMFERAALVLTDEVIDYIVGSVQEHNNDIFSLSDDDAKHLIGFMHKTREISRQKLIDSKATPKFKNAIDAAPWLKDMISEASKYHDKKSSIFSNGSTLKLL
jgi:hypothetical protein